MCLCACVYGYIRGDMSGCVADSLCVCGSCTDGCGNINYVSLLISLSVCAFTVCFYRILLQLYNSAHHKSGIYI